MPHRTVIATSLAALLAGAAPLHAQAAPRPVFAYATRTDEVRVTPERGARRRRLVDLRLRDTVHVEGKVVHRDVTLVVERAALAAAARTAAARLAADPVRACPSLSSPEDTTARAEFDADDGGEPHTAFLRCATDARTHARHGGAGYELIRPRLPMAEYRRLLAALTALATPGGS